METPPAADVPWTPFRSPGRDERRSMLAAVGAESVEALFEGIPPELRCDDFVIPRGRSELETLRIVRELAERHASGLVNFCGAGFYDHFIPAAVDALAARGEFFTAYTPYQPEASQGTLQAVFEFQTAVARLMDMDAANASLYDGGTALFEGMTMALRATRRNRVLVCEGVNPIYRTMLKSYTRNLSIEYREIPLRDGRGDRDAFAEQIDDRTAAILLQNPNFFGCLDDASDLCDLAHAAGALAVMSVYPLSLGILKAPGAMGADIATAEGQSLGLPLSFGGPYLGLLAARKQWVRRMPGRIAGLTRDAEGRRGFVLTLQAREQHIRREKATSNICTNQALCALRALIYLTLTGAQGLPEAARQCAARARYAFERLAAIDGVERTFDAPFFNEFALTLPCDAAGVISELIDEGVAAGFPATRYFRGMERVLLVAVTEKRTREEIDILAAKLTKLLREHRTWS
jgi:glycine dehydrogenase subunit 1